MHVLQLSEHYQSIDVMRHGQSAEELIKIFGSGFKRRSSLWHVISSRLLRNLLLIAALYRSLIKIYVSSKLRNLVCTAIAYAIKNDKLHSNKCQIENERNVK